MVLESRIRTVRVLERIRKHPVAAVEIGVADSTHIRSKKRVDETNIRKK